MKFRKKGEIYKAEQYQPNMEVLPEGVIEGSTAPDMTGYACASVKTKFGHSTILPGDWVLTDVYGDRFVCPPDVFAVSFEPYERQGSTSQQPQQQEGLSPFEAQALEKFDHIIRLLQRQTLITFMAAAKWDPKEMKALTKILEAVEL